MPARKRAAVLALLVLAGCGPNYDPTLPDSSVLGSPRGYRIVRAITHFHSPYSWDACDKNGLSGGQPDPSCLANLAKAICSNRIDFLFLTDHPDHMADYGFELLTLPGAGNCENGARPVILAGFESNLMAIGMNGHLDPDPVVRKDLYQQQTPTIANRLRNETAALVVVPHTENKSIDWLKDLKPDAIEIYNFHANVDPKIRKADLQWPALQEIPGVLTYLFDPYHHLKADFAFLSFFQIHPRYFQDWDRLIADGFKVTGLGGSDSHENTFPQKVGDGERFDSHRRIARMFSNYLLLKDKTANAAKVAISLGRSWLVFEGLGTPVGMDFSAAPIDGAGQEGASLGSGDTLAFSAKARLRVNLPALYSGSAGNGNQPWVRVYLKRILPDGTVVTVATGDNSDINYVTDAAGPFRAELFITPIHLIELLSDFSTNAQLEYPWIITNPIYLEKAP